MRNGHITRAHVRAEGKGFEPLIPCGIHAFQACALDHYANPPWYDQTTRIKPILPRNAKEYTGPMENKYLHEVVMTAIIIKDGKYLITRRSPNKKRFPSMWTVPG